jgi:hypothetical protein
VEETDVSDPRDLRRLVADIRSALDGYPKEQLAEILTFVFREYVVEGPVPLAASAASLVEARPELEGQSFAQVMTWLQLHLDLPELSLFEVQEERVSVRVAGRLLPLEAQASRPEPLPPPRPVETAPAPAQPAAPAAAAPSRPMPVTQTPAVATAPRPAPAPAPAAGPSPAPAAQQPAQGAAQQPAQKTEETAGDASSRFSLLEVD